MEPLTAHHLGAAYGARAVLRDVSFSLGDGEILGVLGPNGAGKSTLLKLLAGLEAPTHGEVRVMGDPLVTLSRAEVARRVALVPQRERVMAGVTVRELVSMGRAPHTGWLGALRARDLAAIEQALADSECAALADRPFSALSGGEQKRCLVARALAQQTPVVLLDEPIAFLDVQHQLGLCDLLAASAAAGRFSAVVVLHDLNIAAQYCHRLLLLRDGEVLALGTPADVMTEDRIREAFRASVYVGTLAPSDTRFFVPMRAPR